MIAINLNDGKGGMAMNASPTIAMAVLHILRVGHDASRPRHRRSRREASSVLPDLGFASQRWQAFVQKRENGEILLGRHALELYSWDKNVISS
jgi:hypothetical protein